MWRRGMVHNSLSSPSSFPFSFRDTVPGLSVITHGQFPTLVWSESLYSSLGSLGDTLVMHGHFYSVKMGSWTCKFLKKLMCYPVKNRNHEVSWFRSHFTFCSSSLLPNSPVMTLNRQTISWKMKQWEIIFREKSPSTYSIMKRLFVFVNWYRLGCGSVSWNK